MNNDRILAFSLAQKLDDKDLQNVAAAGMTSSLCGGVSGQGGCVDTHLDLTVDF